MTRSGPVVVVGGGFAGLESAIRLRQLQPECPVVLISTSPDLLYRPWLIHLPAKRKRLSQMLIPLPPLAQRHGFKLILGRTAEVDAQGSQVRLESGEIVPYAQLLLAAGSTADRGRIPGATENALFPCELQDAERLATALESTSLKSITVLLGGERLGVGLEYAGWIARVRPDVALTVVDMDGAVPGHLGRRAAKRVVSWLSGNGNRWLSDGPVLGVERGRVELASGPLAADLVVVATPLRGAPVGLPAGVLDGLGFVPVSANGESAQPGLFVHGDLAAYQNAAQIPKTMVWARSHADPLARNVLDRRAGREPARDLIAAGPQGMMPDIGGRTVWVRRGRLVASGRWPLTLRRLADISYFNARGVPFRIDGAPDRS